VERPARGSYGVVHFLLLPLLATVGWVVVDVLVRRSGTSTPQTFSGFVFYVCLAAWTAYRARRPPYGLDLVALTALPRRGKDWRLVLLDIPLLATSACALYLVVFALSFIAPGMVTGWLSNPDPVPTAFTLGSLPGDLAESTIGAVAEEWLFRGVLLHVWSASFGVRFGVLATSLLFAALHADVVGTLVFGIVMCALYVRTGTLLVPIVAHLLFNAAIAGIGILAGPDEPMTLPEFREGWWQPALVFAASVAVIAVVLRRVMPEEWRLPPARPTARAPHARGP
jgi:membrane protease YdiL (CAAX protease family)